MMLRSDTRQQCMYGSPYSDEIYGKSTQGTMLKVHSVGYNAVAGNTGSIFIR